MVHFYKQKFAFTFDGSLFLFNKALSTEQENLVLKTFGRDRNVRAQQTCYPRLEAKRNQLA